MKFSYIFTSFNSNSDIFSNSLPKTNLISDPPDPGPTLESPPPNCQNQSQKRRFPLQALPMFTSPYRKLITTPEKYVFPSLSFLVNNPPDRLYTKVLHPQTPYLHCVRELEGLQTLAQDFPLYNVVRMWCLCGAYVVRVWCVCGACVVRMWCVCGACVVRDLLYSRQ